MMMSKLREKLDMLMLAIQNYQKRTNAPDPGQISDFHLRNIIGLTLGYDDRTINKFIKYLGDFGLIVPINQFLWKLKFKSVTLEAYA